MEKHVKIAALYIATLKAISLIHQANHWTSRGEAFYSSHLLFERIYNSALKDLDLAAEKFVGLFGDQVLDYDTQNELLFRTMSIFSKYEGSNAEMSLAVEQQFLNFSSKAANYLEEADGNLMTQGLRNTFEEIASHREEAVYLLQQTLDRE